MSVCVIGDVHGHLQLALCIAAQWQHELRTTFEAVFICGDIGSFTEESQLDSTTRRHGKANPCELEFLNQWSATPQPQWLGKIFEFKEEGLGLICPVIMVHGNHEGFAHLARLFPNEIPNDIVSIDELPTVDSAGHISYLPSGWKARTSSGLVVGGIGGIERGQRQANYHELAYLDDRAILNIVDSSCVDLLITHQGPAITQQDGGSTSLDCLLTENIARVWCHGHSIRNPSVVNQVINNKTTVVPLNDVAFPIKGDQTDEPGENGWCSLFFGNDGVELTRTRPDFWRDYRRRKWLQLEDGRLVAPPLAKYVQHSK